MKRTRPAGMTIVELLVVISIIGILIAMLIPAIQAAREAARRATCSGHLRQLGVAMQSHHNAQGRFPSGGWGYLWVGDPDRGFNRSQPGGWIYGILPYIEESPLRKMGKGHSDDEKMEMAATVAAHPLAMFNCPSRREAKLYPYNDRNDLRNSVKVEQAAKSDYAVNGGDVGCGQAGPENLEAGDSGDYSWGDLSKATGVCHVRSEVTISEVSDGTSCTYLIGEKYWRRSAGVDQGDDQHMFVGHDCDTLRYTLPKWTPIQDGDKDDPRRFGSAHSGACNFVFVDGSVHTISYGIDPEIHRRLGNRKDGLPISADEF